MQDADFTRPILLRTTTELQKQGPISSVYGTHMTGRRRLFAPGVLVSACPAALSGVSLSG